MNRTKASNILKSKHFVLDSAEFSVFTKEELQKLCIMKILTPLTFDNLGHPIAGGLYDKNLGIHLVITYLLLYIQFWNCIIL